MKYVYYRVRISESGASAPNKIRTDSQLFNEISEEFDTEKEAINFLKERYGENFSFKNKKAMYIDEKMGAQKIGITFSYWNKDISHNSKPWYQTDWIRLSKIEENDQPILILRD